MRPSRTRSASPVECKNVGDTCGAAAAVPWSRESFAAVNCHAPAHGVIGPLQQERGAGAVAWLSTAGVAAPSSHGQQPMASSGSSHSRIPRNWRSIEIITYFQRCAPSPPQQPSSAQRASYWESKIAGRTQAWVLSPAIEIRVTERHRRNVLVVRPRRLSSHDTAQVSQQSLSEAPAGSGPNTLWCAPDTGSRARCRHSRRETGGRDRRQLAENTIRFRPAKGPRSAHILVHCASCCAGC